MLIRYKAPGGQLEIEFDATSEKDLFTKLGPVQELIDQCKCEKCGSTHVLFNHRVHGEYDFYELKCVDCDAALGFGQRKDGSGLFPKRKDRDGNLLDNDGWVVYEGRQSSSQPQWGSGAAAVTQREPVPSSEHESGPVDDSSIPF